MDQRPLPQSQSRPQQVQTQSRTLAPVFHETIINAERELIQPVIHREREQTEVHQVTQPLFEREVCPVIVENAVLPTEVRPTTMMQQQQVRAMPQLSTQVIAPTQRQVMECPARIEETIHKTVINEITPVVHKETIQPHLINETRPIYEKIVEAPTFLTEVRPVQQLLPGQESSLMGQGPPLFGQGGREMPSSTTASTGQARYPLHHDLNPPVVE